MVQKTVSNIKAHRKGKEASAGFQDKFFVRKEVDKVSEGLKKDSQEGSLREKQGMCYQFC